MRKLSKWSAVPSVEKAFTLSELLVVTAVIAILAAICLPVIGGPGENDDAANCMNTLRKAGQAFSMYINDNDDWFPQLRTPDFWYRTLESGDYTGPAETAFRCPSDPGKIITIWRPSYGALWTDSVLNYSMSGNNPKMPGFEDTVPGTDRIIPARLSQVPTPGRTLVIADSFLSEKEQSAGTYRVSTFSDNAGVFAGRHGGNANVLMVSGEVLPYTATLPRTAVETPFDLNVWRHGGTPLYEGHPHYQEGVNNNWRRKTDPGVTTLSPGWRIGYVDW